VVFPEGTRSRSGRVRPFHSAAVRTILSEQAMPIISVAVDGGYRIAGVRGLATNLVGCIYRVKLLSMYSITRQRSGIKEIVDCCHGEISKQVEQWRRIES
jgi:1-acyl-sn-glycerol-3-phosphate acyltransferase